MSDERHLFEFEGMGFYVALNREHAITLVETEGGCDPEDARESFLREVPDDELIGVSAEESWDDPREESLPPAAGRPYGLWRLTLRAAEWVATHPREFGYAFGGDD